MVISNKRVDARIKPGGNNDRDPKWLEENTSLDEIELWLSMLLEHQDGKTPSGRPMFTEWEKKYLKSVNEQYDRKHEAGYHDAPLSGKQLIYLKIMVDKILEQTIEQLDKL